MKIIFGIDYLSKKNTGIFSVVKNLSFELNKKSNQMFIATLTDEKIQEDLSYFSFAKIFLIHSRKTKFNFYKIFKSYYRFYVNCDADIAHIHSFWSISSVAIYFWAIKKNKPFIISSHGMLSSWALSQSKYKKLFFLSIIFKSILKNAKFVHLNSFREKEFLLHKGWNFSYSIIPCASDLINPLKISKNKYQKKRILFLSRIHRKKGIDILLDAWADLVSHGYLKNWELNIVGFGDFSNLNNFEQFIQNRVRGDINLFNVNLFEAKFGEEMWKELNDCNVFILPTFSEGSSIVILNAWAVGKFCITTPFSNLDHGLDKECTYLIDPSIIGVKSGLLFIDTIDENELNRMGEIGKKVVDEYYTWQNVTNRYISLYEEILGINK